MTDRTRFTSAGEVDPFIQLKEGVDPIIATMDCHAGPWVDVAGPLALIETLSPGAIQEVRFRALVKDRDNDPKFWSWVRCAQRIADGDCKVFEVITEQTGENNG